MSDLQGREVLAGFNITQQMIRDVRLEFLGESRAKQNLLPEKASSCMRSMLLAARLRDVREGSGEKARALIPVTPLNDMSRVLTPAGQTAARLERLRLPVMLL